MGLECEWRHAQKRWSWEFEDFEKESVGSWLWIMQADNWASTIGAENGVLCYRVEFLPLRRVPTSKDELRSKTPWDVPNVGVWLRKTFKNCVSLLVSKKQSQKLINSSYLNNRVRLCFVFCICKCVCTIGLISLWLWEYNTELKWNIRIYQPLHIGMMWHKVNF